VSFGCFSWVFLSFYCFFFWCSPFLGCLLCVFGSPLCFSWVHVGRHGENCKFCVLENIGRFRGTFGVDLWLLGFSFCFGGDPVLGCGVFDVFWGLHWVSLGFP